MDIASETLTSVALEMAGHVDQAAQAKKDCSASASGEFALEMPAMRAALLSPAKAMETVKAAAPGRGVYVGAELPAGREVRVRVAVAVAGLEALGEAPGARRFVREKVA